MPITQSTGTPPGWPAPDFMLPGTDGRDYLLTDFTAKEGTLIIFTCNHCPYAKALWPVFIKLHEEFGDSIDFVAINPNDDSAYPEDSFAVMKEKAEEWRIPFPYLRDQSQTVADSYHAVCTPDSFLFRNAGGTLELFYRGKVNDNWQEPDNVTTHYLRDAIELLLAGKPAPVEQPPSVGCSIKWKQT
ncbi:MAG: Thiol-disulfide oxidoreductase ResA [candidate division WS6 bacterium OLB20]|uniref:Thiol-disulfide oxidoreductase ResA n=1 Tax=candidate division WS6 bacterium OLB20 TaxID=1617426 RepID=A0A136LXQ1_9BACT|nr:MAG: Thiol-disulfide oxidoreductase ResA [candidate division WS6 bacterium OLB20]